MGVKENKWLLHHPLLQVSLFCLLGISYDQYKKLYSLTLNFNILIFYSCEKQHYLAKFTPAFIIKILDMQKFLFLLLLFATISTSAIDWGQLDSLVNQYMNTGAFPGAALRVANKTHTLYSNNYGRLSVNPSPFGSPFVTNDTIYDIASLSKVTGTLGCIMQLVDVGILHVGDPVIKHIPEYNNHGKENTTIQNLLLHNAGLLPDYPGTLPSTKAEVMDFIYNCKLQSPIGTKFVYSDLSFILLGEIAERLMGAPLDDYVRNNLHRLEIYNTTYLPDPNLLYRIAPTEVSKFRGQVIRGEVHDPTAYLFKGVAGHAGIFSVADDLVSYMQVHLNKGVTKSGKRVYNESTVELFYTRIDGLPYENRRALGWDTVPIQTHPPCGHYFSPHSFGHTGYTGTMMWADIQKQLIVVFLANRVHPTSENQQMPAARSDVCDLIVQLLKSKND